MRDTVPAGWRDFFGQLQDDLANVGVTSILQAKEKFGRLQVYAAGGGPEAAQLIDDATKRSEVTCQVCGTDGRLRIRNGIVATLCDQHA